MGKEATQRRKFVLGVLALWIIQFPFSPFRFQVLEIGKFGDWRDDIAPELILELPDQPSKLRIPSPHGFHERFQVSIFPVAAFVFYIFENAHCLCTVQQPYQGEMTADEIGHAADIGIAGKLCLAKRLPLPALEARGQYCRLSLHFVGVER